MPTPHHRPIIPRPLFHPDDFSMRGRCRPSHCASDPLFRRRLPSSRLRVTPHLIRYQMYHSVGKLGPPNANFSPPMSRRIFKIEHMRVHMCLATAAAECSLKQAISAAPGPPGPPQPPQAKVLRLTPPSSPSLLSSGATPLLSTLSPALSDPTSLHSRTDSLTSSATSQLPTSPTQSHDSLSTGVSMSGDDDLTRLSSSDGSLSSFRSTASCPPAPPNSALSSSSSSSDASPSPRVQSSTPDTQSSRLTGLHYQR